LQVAKGAHEAGNEISALCFSLDNVTLLSRGVDATLKVSGAVRMPWHTCPLRGG
jgi:hypothetical protein